METIFRLDEKTLWRFVNIIFLACIGLFGGGSFLGIASVRLVHVLAVLAVVFALALLSKMTLRGRLFGILGIMLTLLGAGAYVGFKNCLSFFRSYFYWVTGRVLWQGEFLLGCEVFQAILIALFSCFLQGIMEKEFRLKIAGLLVLFSALLYCLFSEKELPQLGVAFVLCYAAIIYTEWTQMRWEKEKGRGTPAYMLWVMPFLGVYFLLMLFPSVPEKPYDWQLVKSACRQMKDSFLKLTYNLPGIGGDDYGLILSGFSEEANLGGSFSESRREIMVIRSGAKLASNIYLAGKVYDTFDGREWTQKNGDSSRERYMDTMETLHAVERYDGKYMADYLYQADLSINYRYFRSRFVFAPLKTLSLQQNYRNINCHESGGSLLFDRRKGYGTEYEVSFYQLNIGQEAFGQFLEEAKDSGAEEEGLEEFLRDFEKRTGEKIRISDMRNRKQVIFEHYLGDVVLSEGAGKYLQKVTAGARTDVDRLKAIEKELASFTYTHTPGKLPENVTDAAGFLDYFLLEGREGYCSHFATAFVLLARAEGFPARYVQGFCIPMKGGRETVVYSDMAHAWPEVYFEDIGWIPFEPTPGYSEMRYVPWKLRDRGRDFSVGVDFLPAETEKTQEGTSDELWQELQEGDGLQASEMEGNHMRWLLQNLGLAVLVVICVCIGLFWLNFLVAAYRYRKLSVELKFKTEVCRNLRILSLMGIRREEEETLSEFKNRETLLPAEKKNLQFLDSYEDFLYGDKEVTGQTLNEAKRQQLELLQLLKQRKRWAYFCWIVCGGFRGHDIPTGQ